MKSQISSREDVEEILEGLRERRSFPGFLLPSQ